MRSVRISAWLHLLDGLGRGVGRQLHQPQFSCIFACRKYWLIAVSSAGQLLVEELDDSRVTLHGREPSVAGAGPSSGTQALGEGARRGAGRG